MHHSGFKTVLHHMFSRERLRASAEERSRSSRSRKWVLSEASSERQKQLL